MSDSAARAHALKERIHAGFTSLAVLLVLLSAGSATAGEAALTVELAVAGVCGAGFVADVLAYQIAHHGLPIRSEVRLMLTRASGAFLAGSTPTAALLCTTAGWLTTAEALQLAVGTALATLAVVAIIATRRSGLNWRDGPVAFVGLALLGAGVVGVLSYTHTH